MKLHIGCGARVEDNWVNIDLSQNGDRRILAHDVRRPLPFESRSVDMIYSEHFLEHLERHDATFFISEALRVLKPGGAFRVSTPDMEHLAALYLAAVNKTELGSEVAYHAKISGDPLKYYEPVGWKPFDTADLINGGMRLWEHKFIWDYPTLSATMLGLGFDLVGRAPYRRTRYDGMLLEGRPDLGDLIVEAQKPDVAHHSAR